MRKYTNVRTRAQGIEFDSRLEARRYVFLKNWERNGMLSELRTQVVFQLSTEANYCGAWVGRKYIADFCYLRDGNITIEDVKCSYTAKNEVFRAKKKRLLEMGVYVREILPNYVPFLDLPYSIAYKQKIVSKVFNR